MRVVLDTNVLIDGFADDFSAQYQLVEAVCTGQLEAAVTPATKREGERLLRRLIKDEQYRVRIQNFFAQATLVPAASVETVIDDEEDRKFLAAAVGGEADLLITNDRHLLDIGTVSGIPIVTPQEGWNRFREEELGTNDWLQWTRDIIG